MGSCTQDVLAKWLPAAVLLLLASLPLLAQGSGTLDVKLTLQSSISLTFDSYPGACPLGGSGTNNVSLYLGWGSAPLFGLHGGCGNYTTVDLLTYRLSSPLNLNVNVANSTSVRYDLRAWITTVPYNGISYYLNSQQLALTRPATALQTNSYGTTQETLAAQVASLTAPAGHLTDTIQFEATAR